MDAGGSAKQEARAEGCRRGAYDVQGCTRMYECRDGRMPKSCHGCIYGVFPIRHHPGQDLDDGPLPIHTPPISLQGVAVL